MKVFTEIDLLCMFTVQLRKVGHILQIKRCAKVRELGRSVKPLPKGLIGANPIASNKSYIGILTA